MLKEPERTRGPARRVTFVGQLRETLADGPVRPLVLAGTVSLFVALVVLALAPTLAGLLPSLGGPTWVTGGLAVLLVFGALASFGNGSLNVGLSTLVSTASSADSQGTAFGVTQGAGSLGRTVGPPLAAAASVAVYWSPFVAGALLLLPVAVLLRLRR